MFITPLDTDPDYYPGKGCSCHAICEEECVCEVDWTSAEVYELRTQVHKLKEKLVRTQEALDEALRKLKHDEVRAQFDQESG